MDGYDRASASSANKDVRTRCDHHDGKVGVRQGGGSVPRALENFTKISGWLESVGTTSGNYGREESGAAMKGREVGRNDQLRGGERMGMQVIKVG